MSRTAPEHANRSWGLMVRVLLAILVGLLAALVALRFPAGSIKGDLQTGPQALSMRSPVRLDFRPSLSWAPRHAGVILTVRPEHPCLVRLEGVTSTAPGRIEVHAQEEGSRCHGPRRPTRFLLPTPTLPDPRRNVRVFVDQEVLSIPWAPVGWHPRGSSDA